MKPYRDFADFLGEHFKGKVQKIAVNAGFTCPNRDGTKGRGGCTYCNNKSFNPGYCAPALSVAEQLEQGKAFFARKYPEMKYLAYFQAYTNTHSDDIDRLMTLYEEALAVDDVVGLIIGTRPDCMPQQLLDRLAALSAWVMVEYGAESAHDSTLERVNRCHTWADTADAVTRTHAAGLPTGLHLIMGLPGEDEAMMLETIDRVNELPVDTVKIHQLQLIRGTRLARDVEEGLYDIPRFTAEEYADLCVKLLHRLRSDIALERFVSQSPPELLIYPKWNLKNYQFTNLLHNRLKL
ncbi:TIGR01212 family radical SAM protein [uncultured Duncaniella sp.]|uniref:TIGR01212 family radical SAM protein n=2 Tax=Muribaculaceae TaxID=2005473 RepID=UPI00262BCC0F|nr:TIGR01212 family radical SAM protein [uncultured Duncaniella sp.]